MQALVGRSSALTSGGMGRLRGGGLLPYSRLSKVHTASVLLSVMLPNCASQPTEQ
jgi:hypothetical protein